jgi:hypothetical protein
MSIGDWNEGELKGWLKRLLGTEFGIVPLHRVVGALNSLTLKELAADPEAPDTDQVVLYAKDSGGGKTVLYARFHTGAIQQVAIEP